MYSLMSLNRMAVEMGLNKLIKVTSLSVCFPANPCTALWPWQPAPGKHHEPSRVLGASSEQTEMVVN